MREDDPIHIAVKSRVGEFKSIIEVLDLSLKEHSGEVTYPRERVTRFRDMLREQLMIRG